MRVLVAGAGWLGGAVARALAARGDRVTAVRRTAARLRDLEAPRIEGLAIDLGDPGAAGRLPGSIEAVVACQSAEGDGAGPYRRAYVDVNRVLLDRFRGRGLRSFVYTGSTGVFGQRDGGEVDESTPPSPSGPAAEVLVEAERALLEAAGAGTPAVVLRLSGIYGPGRPWPVERVRAGALALGPGDGAWMNLCHLDDAVTAVLAALDRGRPGLVYHASDAHPPRRRELVGWVAARLGIPVPSGAHPYQGPDRRIRAERSRAELGIGLAYPSFREGVEALLAGGAAP
jgi:nucleoside-diphosphate-sugar epimerase